MTWCGATFAFPAHRHARPRAQTVRAQDIVMEQQSLLGQDETLQIFSWPYDTGALINEMKHMSEIVFSLSLPSLPLSKYCVCALSL